MDERDRRESERGRDGSGGRHTRVCGFHVRSNNQIASTQAELDGTFFLNFGKKGELKVHALATAHTPAPEAC